MALNQEQNGGMELDQLPEETPAQTSSVDESRRRFGKTGLAASGLLLTLTSRPVLGTGTQNPPGKCCKAPSGWKSGNKSFHGKTPVCNGQPPDFWKNCPTKWPINCSGHPFQNHFPCGANFTYGQATMLAICGNQYANRVELAEFLSRLVAAYLNCKDGRTPFLKEETIKAMFTECQNNGHFCPTAGENWTRKDCIDYLKATQET